MPLKLLHRLPGVLINGILAAGDLHIGIEAKLMRKGISFPNAYAKMAKELIDAYSNNKASKLVLLGDIKEAISYPEKDAYAAIQKFFYAIRGLNITIVKGNHDAHLAELLARSGYNIEVVKEAIISNVAFLHGNALPSNEAMKCSYIVEAHGHIGIDVDGAVEKAFLIAKPGKGAKELYKGYNPEVRLVMVPPLNKLILGNKLSEETKRHLPIFRKEVFDFESAEVFINKRVGSVKSIIQD